MGTTVEAAKRFMALEDLVAEVEIIRVNIKISAIVSYAQKNLYLIHDSRFPFSRKISLSY
jgi:3-methyladenine DNA glycosylase Tag